MRRLTLVAAFAGLLIGCVAYTRYGLFETTKINGWRFVYRGESSYSFIAPAPADGGVLFSTPEKGALYLHVYFPRARIAFEDQQLRLIPHDGHSVRTIPLSPDMTIPVPDLKDFTLELPTFTVDGQKMPHFAARFTWSDRTYHIVRVAQ